MRPDTKKVPDTFLAPTEFVKVSDHRLMDIVESLAREIWTEHYIPIIGKAQIDYMLAKFQSAEAISHQITREGYLYYLLKNDNDDFVGYVAVVPKENAGELFLSKIYVRSSERRKGYGRKAMRFVEGLARQMNLHKIALTVNKDNVASIAAYERMGFENTGSIVTDIGSGFVMDDYRMRKSIR